MDKPRKFKTEYLNPLPTSLISEASQITRNISSGPSTAAHGLQHAPTKTVFTPLLAPSVPKKAEVFNLSPKHSVEGEEQVEQKVTEELKKAAIKENLIMDGKINIISKIDIPTSEPLCCKFNEEFNYVAIGNTDGIINIYNSNSGEFAFNLFDFDVKNNRAPVTSIKHRPVSKIYPITNCYTGTYANGCVKCWNYKLNQCLYTIRERRQTFGITYHPRFPKFVTYGDDLKVYFYDEETKTQERVLTSSDNAETHDGPMSRVFAACFHPKNNYELLTGGWDNVVQFWDLRQPHAIRHLSGIHMCGEGIDINQKGTEILVCAWQKEDTIQIFDYGSGKRLYCLEPDIFSSKLYCGKFATKDFLVCAGTDPNLIRVVDLQTTATSAFINQLPGAVYGLDIGPTKQRTLAKQEKFSVKNDITLVPKISFIAAKRLYQIDFI